MKKNKIASIIAGVVGGLSLMLAPASAFAWSNGNSNAGVKVTICHATGSQSHPYVRISPNANGVINGHVGHQDGRDIIPPFSYNDHGTTKNFPGQNWDVTGQAIFNNGCVVGGMGGGSQKDCDGDYDHSPATDPHCQQPQKDCDGDYDNSPATDPHCMQPVKDCDGDYDNSPASDCQQPQPQKDCDSDYDNSPATDCQTGGMGGGPSGGGTTTTVTTSTSGKVLGASTTAVGGLGAGPQVAVTPTGSVNGGEGAGSQTTSTASLLGLLGSLVGVGTGFSLLNRRQN